MTLPSRLQRLAKQRSCAIFNAGRLLNVFRFHAVQAWLLLSAEQFNLARQALTYLAAQSQYIFSDESDQIHRAILRIRDDWDESYKGEEHCDELQAAVKEYELGSFKSHAELCRDLVEGSVEGLCARLSEALKSQLRDEFAILRLGEMLDQGLRPAHVYRCLTLTEQERRAELDALEQELDEVGDDWCTIRERPAQRDANSLARKSRRSGDVPPDEGWYVELVTQIERTDIGLRYPQTLWEARKDWACKDIVELVDRIDADVRDALDVGRAMPRVDEKEFRLTLGKRNCEFGDTDEFRFVQLLVERVNHRVTYNEIRDVMMDSDANDEAIRRLKQRVCDKLRRTDCALDDVAAAIRAHRPRGYILHWPPT